MKKKTRLSPFILFYAITQSTAIASPTAFISIDAATLFAEPGHTQALSLFDTLGNTYVSKSEWQHDETLMLGVGFKILQYNQIDINTGVRYIPQVTLPSKGDVLQLHSPLFRNLSYAYDLTSNFWLADNTITWTKHRLQPGFIIGVGGATNTLTNYQEASLNNHSAPSLDHFKNSRNTQFAYELGAVLDYTLDEITFECAYRYLNAGHAQLGLSPLQNTTAHLTSGLIQYNAVSLGVRFNHAF